MGSPSKTNFSLKRLAHAKGDLRGLAVHGDTLYAAGAHTLLVTGDGKRFSTEVSPGPTNALVASGEALFAAGTSGLFVSTDGAKKWQPIALPFKGALFALHQEVGGTWWLGGDGGVVLRSKDPLRGWTLFPTGPAPGAAKAVLGFCSVGERLFVLSGGGGWVVDGPRVTPFSTKASLLTRMLVSPDGALLAFGALDTGSLFAGRSTDGGATFKKAKLRTTNDAGTLRDACLVGSELVAVGGYGSRSAVLRSSDDGKSFDQVVSKPFPRRLLAIAPYRNGALIGAGDEPAGQSELLGLVSPRASKTVKADPTLAARTAFVAHVSPLAPKGDARAWLEALAPAVVGFRPGPTTRITIDDREVDAKQQVTCEAPLTGRPAKDLPAGMLELAALHNGLTWRLTGGQRCGFFGLGSDGQLARVDDADALLALPIPFAAAMKKLGRTRVHTFFFSSGGTSRTWVVLDPTKPNARGEPGFALVLPADRRVGRTTADVVPLRSAKKFGAGAVLLGLLAREFGGAVPFVELK